VAVYVVVVPPVVAHAVAGVGAVRRYSYRVMALPPLSGAVQPRTTWALPAVAVRLPGAAGAVAVETGMAVLVPELAPLPLALTALTSKVYCVLFVRPVTVCVTVLAPEPVIAVHVPAPVPLR